MSRYDSWLSPRSLVVVPFGVEGEFLPEPGEILPAIASSEFSIVADITGTPNRTPADASRASGGDITMLPERDAAEELPSATLTIRAGNNTRTGSWNEPARELSDMASHTIINFPKNVGLA
uniref:Uncharacterized protein n=1 Tax=Anopheles culicifacies TaxID=139723 RepID=A0A182MSZ6_9DIPT